MSKIVATISKQSGNTVRQSVRVSKPFRVTPLIVERIRNNKCTPQFDEIQRMPDSRSVDVYYDHQGLLEKEGIMLRRHGWSWEANIHDKTSEVDQDFQKISGREEIEGLVRNYIPEARLLAMGAHGLHETMSISFEREQYLANRLYRININKTNFGFMNGTVELAEGSDYTSMGAEDVEDLAMKESLKSAAALELDSSVDSFMRHYGWAFPQDKTLSMLNAYRQWKQSLQPPT